MCCRGWNLAEMFIFLTSCKTRHSPAFWGLSCTSQLQVARGQITTASVQIFVFIPIPKSLQTTLPRVFHEMKLNIHKAVKSKKKILKKKKYKGLVIPQTMHYKCRKPTIRVALSRHCSEKPKQNTHKKKVIACLWHPKQPQPDPVVTYIMTTNLQFRPVYFKMSF